MSRIIHFWDMDHTIVNNDCDVSWKEFMISKALTGIESRQKADFFYEQYKNECLDVDAFLRFQLDEFRGHSASHMRDLCKEHFFELVEPNIYQKARDLIKKQQSENELVCLLTATNRLIAEPLAESMGFEYILATELELKNDLFTGAHTDIYCCGSGKIDHMNRFIAEHGGSMQTSSYFGDSSNDIVILEKVGFPFAVNPVEKLRQRAQESNWQILDFG
jgi:HAD superfamily hydrolase (TIGR01490 family)